MSTQSVTPRAIVQAIANGQGGRMRDVGGGKAVFWAVDSGWGVYASDVGDRYVIELKKPSGGWHVHNYIMKGVDPTEAVGIARRAMGLPTD